MKLAQLAPFGVYAVSLIALVAVIVTGHDPGVLMSIVAPVLATFYVSTKVDQVHNVAQQVQHQTNGALDARIRQAVSDAMKDRPAAPS